MLCAWFAWKLNFCVRLCYVIGYGGFSILNTLYYSHRNGGTKFQYNSLLFQTCDGKWNGGCGRYGFKFTNAPK